MDSLPHFILDHLPDVVYASNSAGRLVFANRATCRLLQYHREEIESLHLWDIDTAFIDETWSIRWSLIKENKELQGESRLKRCDGLLIPVEVTRVWDQMTPPGGAPQEVLVVLARDVAYRTEEVDRAVQRLLRRRVIRQLQGQEGEFYRMLEQGNSESEIRERLGISRSTYYRMKRRIANKLGVDGSDFSEFWW